MRYRNVVLGFAVTVVATATLAGSAMARGPTGAGSVAAGPLPVTGVDLVLLVGGGLVVALIAAGLVRAMAERTGS